MDSKNLTASAIKRDHRSCIWAFQRLVRDQQNRNPDGLVWTPPLVLQEFWNLRESGEPLADFLDFRIRYATRVAKLFIQRPCEGIEDSFLLLLLIRFLRATSTRISFGYHIKRIFKAVEGLEVFISRSSYLPLGVLYRPDSIYLYKFIDRKTGTEDFLAIHTVHHAEVPKIFAALHFSPDALLTEHGFYIPCLALGILRAPHKGSGLVSYWRFAGRVRVITEKSASDSLEISAEWNIQGKIDSSGRRSAQKILRTWPENSVEITDDRAALQFATANFQYFHSIALDSNLPEVAQMSKSTFRSSVGNACPLMAAAAYNNVDWMKELVESDPKCVSDLDDYGNNAMHFCVAAGAAIRAMDVLAFLLTKTRIDLLERNQDGFDCFELAMALNDERACVMLEPYCQKQLDERFPMDPRANIGLVQV